MSTSLTLELPEKTLKKLRALAMLSGSSVTQMEKQLVQYFDEMLTENITVLLSELDGKNVARYRLESPAREEVAEEEAFEEEEEGVPQDENSHSLSDDDDTEENKSLEEQAELVKKETLKTKPATSPKEEAADQDEFNFNIDVPNVDNNAEAFLDTAMSSSAPSREPAQQSGMYGVATPAGMSFNPKKRNPMRNVSEYTGDERGAFS